jgi:hypothetical protein
MQVLYHGSYIEITEPRIIGSNRLLDYGTGFYATTDSDQAIKFTEKFIRLGKSRILNSYRFDEVGARGSLRILTFADADDEWLEYVVANRSGTGRMNDYDIVIGPVANDKVYDVVELYEAGDYTAAEAIVRLKTYRLIDQVVFKSEESLRFLEFLESKALSGGGLSD